VGRNQGVELHRGGVEGELTADWGVHGPRTQESPREARSTQWRRTPGQTGAGRGRATEEARPPHRPHAAPRIANRRRPDPGGARSVDPRPAARGAVRRRPLAARDRDCAVTVGAGAPGARVAPYPSFQPSSTPHLARGGRRYNVRVRGVYDHTGEAVVAGRTAQAWFRHAAVRQAASGRRLT